MNKATSLLRFLKAQENQYQQAHLEITAGKKLSHWMWYVFPQFKGLGRSDTSKFYAIQDINEAKEYLRHPILGFRLCEIAHALLILNENDPLKIFGSPNDLKLKSCMTLFSTADGSEENLFMNVLKKYFDGELDTITIDLLNKIS